MTSRFASQLASHVRPTVSRLLVSTLLISALTARVASAQSLATQTRALSRDGGHSHIIFVNPFLPLLGYFAGEYEQRLSPALSLSVAGSQIKPDHVRYSNLDAKFKLFPSEQALWGFNVAASVGVARLEDTDSTYYCVSALFSNSECPTQKPFVAPTFAVETGFQWLLGPGRTTAIAVSGGAKRYLGSESKYDNITRVLPTLRLEIGYAW
jgi:hypothetical protein